MNPGVQVFLYPEELEHVEPDALAEQVLGLGCDAVSVAVAYHRGRRVFPRHRRVSVLTRTTVYIEPDPARYGALRPEGTATPALHRFREACDRAGLRFRAWVVGLHNDSLAEAHPEAAARLLDGSPAGHSLCPSTPEAVEYVAALAADVAAQLGPEAVDLEAAFYPAWEPSYTLTLALEPLTDEEKLHWAQCSCPACLAMPDRAEGARRLIEAVAAAVHAEGSLLRRLRVRAARAGGAPGRLAGVGRRGRRAPLRLRPAPRRRAAGALRRPARAHRSARAPSRRTGRPSAPTSRPTSSASRRPEPKGSRSTTSRSSRRPASRRSARAAAAFKAAVPA